MSAEGQNFSLRELKFLDLPGWRGDDPRPLLDAMQACLRHLRSIKPYRTGSLGLSSDDLLPLLEAAETFQPSSAADAREFFERHCSPFAILPKETAQGFVTGFYEPEVEVSAVPDNVWKYPFYNRPTDLIDLDAQNRPVHIDASYAFGLSGDNGIDFYPDRKVIDQGYLQGRNLEIAWAKSKVDVFFAHVQGAARLKFPDGSVTRITYAAKAGHPFSGIGRLLIDRGCIDPATVSMQSIRRWLGENPALVDEVLWHNPSYIFFKVADVSDETLGPVAAAKVPLIAGRSLAVDRSVHTFGYPFFIHAAELTHLDEGKPFARLMLALDTGSAIIGPARGDIFTGSGYLAGEQAGTIRNNADFYILLPNHAAQRYRP
ncbi:murein transglycosylase A [Agrobacterium sp.]|jgi:membrane-bound lytic murein transglycosylase A|uniref:murein transglycosylase A n=1 Tax=Agrobacterium sp. TaxID=361 RepID=UPI0028AF5EFE